MRKAACALVVVLGVMPGTVMARKPYHAADFRQMRVVETWEKYAGASVKTMRSEHATPTNRGAPWTSAGIAVFETVRTLSSLRQETPWGNRPVFHMWRISNRGTNRNGPRRPVV